MNLVNDDELPNLTVSSLARSKLRYCISSFVDQSSPN